MALSQMIPSRSENLENLVTFGKQAPDNWGDDDHVQIFFMLIPKDYNKPVYLSVFDPGIEGENDQVVAAPNTQTRFSVYSGKGCYSTKAARSINPVGNYKSGNLVTSKTFGKRDDLESKWYQLAMVNPKEGEYVEEFDGYVFKVICEGLTGDDGNHYKYFLSSSKKNRIPVPGGNGFTYEYSFQLKNKAKSVCHIYPYVDDKVDYLVQHNFDFDSDGYIKINSIARNGHHQKLSADGEWSKSRIAIRPKERNKSIDIQIEKKTNEENDMVFYVVNQYNEPVPFFASPIGVTKYEFPIDVKTKTITKKL